MRLSVTLSQILRCWTTRAFFPLARRNVCLVTSFWTPCSGKLKNRTNWLALVAVADLLIIGPSGARMLTTAVAVEIDSIRIRARVIEAAGNNNNVVSSSSGMLSPLLLARRYSISTRRNLAFHCSIDKRLLFYP